MSQVPYSADPIRPVSPMDEKKHSVEIVEDVGSLHPSLEHQAQLKSTLDSLPLLKSAWLFRKTVLICTIAGFCAATDGYQNTLSASIIANKGFVQQFGELNAKGVMALVPKHVSTFGGIFSAGQVLGQASIPKISDWFGRKVAIYGFLFLLLLAVIVESVSTVWWHWTIAKFIAGVGIGSVQATLPVYINEHAPTNLRGVLVVAYSLWFSAGGLFGAVALKARRDQNPFDWKNMVYTQYGMIGLAFIASFVMPESPWWLISKGKTQAARKILTSKFANVEGYDIDTELAIIEATIEDQKRYDQASRAEGLFVIFKGLNRKRFLIGSFPKVLQQFVGLSIFSSYSSYVFSIAGAKDPFMVTVILSCSGLAAVFVDAMLVEKIGRRRMTLFGFSGACTGILVMGIAGMFDYTKPNLAAVLVFGGVLANFCNSFQASLDSSPRPVIASNRDDISHFGKQSSTSYAYLTECPEQRFKARGTGWGLAYCNLYAIVFNFTVPLMVKAWNIKAVWLFVCLGIPGTVLAFFIMPETSQRSSAEIHEMFVEGVPLRKWKGHVTQVQRDLEQREASGLRQRVTATA